MSCAPKGATGKGAEVARAVATISASSVVACAALVGFGPVGVTSVAFRLDPTEVACDVDCATARAPIATDSPLLLALSPPWCRWWMRAARRCCARPVRRYWCPRFFPHPFVRGRPCAYFKAATAASWVMLAGACAVGAEASATAGVVRIEDFASTVPAVRRERRLHHSEFHHRGLGPRHRRRQGCACRGYARRCRLGAWTHGSAAIGDALTERD
jgi:hypothetical protein